MLVQIGVFIMAVAFAVFAVALSRLLLRSSTGIEAIQTAAVEMESKLDISIIALEGTLDETNGTMSDMEVKLNALDSVFLSADELGDAANVISEELNEITAEYANTGDSLGAKPFIRIIQSTEFAKGLLASWKRGKAFVEK